MLLILQVVSGRNTTLWTGGAEGEDIDALTGSAVIYCPGMSGAEDFIKGELAEVAVPP